MEHPACPHRARTVLQARATLKQQLSLQEKRTPHLDGNPFAKKPTPEALAILTFLTAARLEETATKLNSYSINEPSIRALLARVAPQPTPQLTPQPTRSSLLFHLTMTC